MLVWENVDVDSLFGGMEVDCGSNGGWFWSGVLVQSSRF